jgi:hypothetical protein
MYISEMVLLVSQAGLELEILLPQPPRCYDYKQALTCLAMPCFWFGFGVLRQYHYVAHAGLELGNPPAYASQMLGLQA